MIARFSFLPGQDVIAGLSRAYDKLILNLFLADCLGTCGGRVEEGEVGA